MIVKRTLLLAMLSPAACAANFSESLNMAISGAAVGLLRLKSDDTVAVDSAMVVDVTSANTAIKGDDSTDNATALQAVFDANPNATIYFPAGTYRSSAPIILTNASGKAFNGNIECASGATIKFTTTGSTSDTNANMQNGFVAYPKTNGAGGDTSGWGDGNKWIKGCTVEGPTNGAGFRLANGISMMLEKVHTKTNRYGIAFESSINAKVRNSSGFASKNAGIAFLYSANASIYYGSSPSSTFWNDNYTVDGYAYADGATNGTLAAIEDHGSKAWTVRTLRNVSVQGKTGATGVQYGYIGRAVFPTFENFVTEAVPYGIGRIISSNAAEGGAATTLTGVTAAQPSGTYRVDSMPDGFCQGGKFTSLYTSGATIAFQPDCNGIIEVGPNFNNGATTDLKLAQASKTVIYKGIVRADGGAPVIVNSFGGFVDQAGVSVSITSGFGTSPSVNSGANSNSFRINVGTGGTANTGVITMGRAADAGWSCTCTNGSNVSICRTEPTSTTTVTVKNYNSSLTLTAWTASDVLQVQCKPY